MKKLDFIIIGAQKCASTYLQNCINEHPEICIPKGETPYFEDPDFTQLGPNYLSKLFNGNINQKFGIKRPQYIGKSEVVKRIFDHNPNVKIIAVLRNPIERALSAYFHYIESDFFHAKRPEVGLREIISKNTNKKYPRSQEVLEFGRYNMYLSEYWKLFPKNNIKVFFVDDFINNPQKIYSEIYRFLGVNDNFRPKKINTRPLQSVKNISRLKFLTLSSRYTTNYNKEHTRLYQKKSLFYAALYKSYRVIDSVIFSRVFKTDDSDISSDLKHQLYKFYENDLFQLSKQLDKDLSGWSYPKNEILPFSIVIPSLNSEKYIDIALSSLKDQSLQNYEIIVCDGGSTDATLEKVRRFNFKNIKILNIKDKGIPVALNKGFDSARGEILCWLNSDDKFVHSNVLAEIFDEYNKRKFEVLYCHSQVIDKDDKVLNKIFAFTPSRGHNIKSSNLFTGSTFFTKKSWEYFGGFSNQYKYSFETEIYLFFSKYYRPKILNIFAGAFRKHGKGVSDVYYKEMKLERMKILEGTKKNIQLLYFVDRLYQHISNGNIMSVIKNYLKKKLYKCK